MGSSDVGTQARCTNRGEHEDKRRDGAECKKRVQGRQDRAQVSSGTTRETPCNRRRASPHRVEIVRDPGATSSRALHWRTLDAVWNTPRQLQR